ncbi:MAG: hypothetical protein AB7G48_10790 [Nitrospiraceae bacterium]
MDDLLQRALEIANRPRKAERVGHAMDEPTVSKPARRMEPGQAVRWTSPLFGPCTGEILATYPDGAVLVWHPKTERLVKIPLDLVRRLR